MYVNKDLNIEWWLPPRTASRMTRIIIIRVGFELADAYHWLGDGKSEKKIIIDVRNPYSIMVSRYKQFYKKNVDIPNNHDWESFSQFIKTFKD